MKRQDYLTPNRISSDETLARIVLSPRDIDAVTGFPKNTFIGLRLNEDGVSFLRFDYLGKNGFLNCGFAREALYNRGRKKRMSFVGWMEGNAGTIKSLAPNTIELSVDDPGCHPEHVNVGFRMEGELVKGIVTDARILDLLDEIYHSLKYISI